MVRQFLERSLKTVIESALMRSMKSRGGLTRGRGVDESVRTVWLSTMHECANVHLAMSSMTGSQSGNQDHVELGATRVDRDRRDLDKILDYLAENSPFMVHDSRLRSLSCGATASDSDFGFPYSSPTYFLLDLCSQ